MVLPKKEIFPLLPSLLSLVLLPLPLVNYMYLTPHPWQCHCLEGMKLEPPTQLSLPGHLLPSLQGGADALSLCLHYPLGATGPMEITQSSS